MIADALDLQIQVLDQLYAESNQICLHCEDGNRRNADSRERFRQSETGITDRPARVKVAAETISSARLTLVAKKLSTVLQCAP